MRSQCKRYEMYIPKYPMCAYRALRAALGDTFGGFTEMPMGVGYWVAPGAEVAYQEGVAVIVLVIAPDREQDLLTILKQYKADAAQQAVMLVSSPVDVVML